MLESLRRVKVFVDLLTNYAYDARRYLTHSQSGRSTLNPTQLKARLFQKSHSIEKALSLPAPRHAFGFAHVRELDILLAEARTASLNAAEPSITMALDCLRAYAAFHGDQLSALPNDIRNIIDKWVAGTTGVDCVSEQNADEVRSLAQGDFRSVVISRHSVRTFADPPVAPSLIARAVELAQLSPSVCNRQTGGVRVVPPRDMAEVLKIQGGNRGFDHEVTALLIVTSGLGVFRGARERNQAFVDGGLFAMTLLYALHYLGLGACPLNWSSTAAQDKRLRRTINVPEDEQIIMLIAVGHLKPEYKVAKSPRRSLDDVLRQ